MVGLRSITECKSNRTCVVSGCSEKHNKVLHSDAPKPSTVQTEKPTVEASTNAVASNNSGVLQLVQIRMANCETVERLHITALLDNASTVTYIDKQTAQSLSLKPLRKVTMCVYGILGTDELNSQQVE